MNKITAILRDLGIPTNQRGSAYLVNAIELAMNDNKYFYGTTELYYEVGAIYGEKPSCIERCIRHSVETAFNRSDPELLARYFGNSYSRVKGKATNSEFITTVVLNLREEATA